MTVIDSKSGWEQRLVGGRIASLRKFRPWGLALLLFLFTGLSLHAIEEPSPSGDFQALDLEGKAFRGASLRGKVVLLDFWAVWCSPCIAAFPTLGKWQQEYGERGLEVVGIASYSGTPQDVAEFLRERAVSYTMVVGSEDLVEQFEVIGYPTYFLIGRDGKVFGKYVGEMKFSKDRLLADLEKLLQTF
ncbi:MAG: TlpA disulfide reductase family protein [Acidobacteriota bacterium]